MTTNRALAEFLGIANDARWPKAIANLAPEKRASYERMAEVTMALQLYGAGLGPKPSGVIICHEHKPRSQRRPRP